MLKHLRTPSCQPSRTRKWGLFRCSAAVCHDHVLHPLRPLPLVGYLQLLSRLPLPPMRVSYVKVQWRSILRTIWSRSFLRLQSSGALTTITVISLKSVLVNATKYCSYYRRVNDIKCVPYPHPKKTSGNFFPRLANRSEFLFRQQNTKFELPSLQHLDVIHRFNCCVVADHSSF
jgi:hypothetical protein